MIWLNNQEKSPHILHKQNYSCKQGDKRGGVAMAT